MSVVDDFRVDPDEFAEALRDGMLAGGATADAANVEAELGRVNAIAYNETPTAERWTLTRTDSTPVVDDSQYELVEERVYWQAAEEHPTPHRLLEWEDCADWDDAEHSAQRAAIEAEYGPEIEEERTGYPARPPARVDDDCDGW